MTLEMVIALVAVPTLIWSRVHHYRTTHAIPRERFAPIVLPACPICGEDVADPRGCQPCLTVLADIIRERRGVPATHSESRATDPVAATLPRD